MANDTLKEAEQIIIAEHEATKDAYRLALMSLGQSARDYVENPDDHVACRCLIRAALLLATCELQVALTSPPNNQDLATMFN